MKRVKPAFTSVDIEALLAYDRLGNYVGRPTLGETHYRIRVYSPSGELLDTLHNARTVIAEKGEHYTRDVYARNFVLI